MDGRCGGREGELLGEGGMKINRRGGESEEMTKADMWLLAKRRWRWGQGRGGSWENLRKGTDPQNELQLTMLNVSLRPLERKENQFLPFLQRMVMIKVNMAKNLTVENMKGVQSWGLLCGSVKMHWYHLSAARITRWRDRCFDSEKLTFFFFFPPAAFFHADGCRLIHVCHHTALNYILESLLCPGHFLKEFSCSVIRARWVLQYRKRRQKRGTR